MPKKRNFWIKLTAVLIVGAAALVVGLWLLHGHRLTKFENAVRSIASDPNADMGESFELSTYPGDQPLVGFAITSRDVNKKTVWAYELLKTELKVVPVTYYSEPGSMPTQETIWQYPNYFVRLYVTSSLETDGVTVDVFEGRYEDMRKDRISSNISADRADLYTHFAPIEFSAPERFLKNR